MWWHYVICLNSPEGRFVQLNDEKEKFKKGTVEQARKNSSESSYLLWKKEIKLNR